VSFKETVIRGHVTSEHLVQLFDDSSSLVETVNGFVVEGLTAGNTVLVVSTREHRRALEGRLAHDGVPVRACLESGQLTSLDAADTLKQLVTAGRPHPRLFERVVGELVHDLAQRGRPLKIYGEMVDLLAAEGDFRGAQELEDLWNQLGERESFTLLCGYHASHFGDERTADSLRAICGAHSRVRTDPRDMLAAFLANMTQTHDRP
jgi:hypothetical protein